MAGFTQGPNMGTKIFFWVGRVEKTYIIVAIFLKMTQVPDLGNVCGKVIQQYGFTK